MLILASPFRTARLARQGRRPFGRPPVEGRGWSSADQTVTNSNESVHVRGYTEKDGTVVHGYDRSTGTGSRVAPLSRPAPAVWLMTRSVRRVSRLARAGFPWCNGLRRRSVCVFPNGESVVNQLDDQWDVFEQHTSICERFSIPRRHCMDTRRGSGNGRTSAIRTTCDERSQPDPGRGIPQP